MANPWEMQWETSPDRAPAAPWEMQWEKSGGEPAQNNTFAVVGNAALRGLTGLVGLPGTISDLTNGAVRWGMDKVGLIPQATPAPPEMFGIPAGQSPVSSDRIQSGLRAAGVLDRPGTEPQTPTQRVLASAAEGAGSTPFGPVGLVTGAMSGAGGELAANAAASTTWGDTPVGQALARVAGGLAGGVLGTGALNTATRGVNAVRGVGNDVTAAFKRAGVQPRMVADVTGSPTMARVQQAASGLPGGTGRVSAAAQQTEQEFAKAVDKAAAMLGPSATPQRAGEALQNGAKAWLQQWKADSNQAWGDFWTLLRPNVSSRLTATRSLLNNSDTELRQQAPEIAKLLESDRMGSLKSAVQGTGAMSAQALRQFRTRVGEMLDTATLAGNEDQAALKRLYGALTTDLESLAAASGKPAVDAFQRANQVTREGHDLLDSTGKHILGAADKPKAPEEAYRWVTGQASLGDTRLSAVRGMTGNAPFNDAAGVFLREAAQPAASAGGVAVASGPRLNTALNKLSSEGRSQLFQGARQQVDDLGTVAGRMADTASLANRSQTAGTSAYQSLFRDIPLAGAGGYAVGGLPGVAAAAAPLLPLAGANMAARAATSPALAKLMSAPGLLSSDAKARVVLGLLSQPGLLSQASQAVAPAPQARP